MFMVDATNADRMRLHLQGENLMNWFRRLFVKFKLLPGISGSATFKVATHDTKVTEAKGAIIALKAVEKSHNRDLDELEGAAASIHAGRDAIQSRVEKLQAGLGI